MKNNKFLRFFCVLFLFLIININSYTQSCPPLVNVLGNDTLICPDGALYLDAGTAVSYLWSDGSSESSLLITLPGQYFVTLLDECDKSYTDTILIGLAENPTINLNVPVQEYFCKGEVVSLTAEAIEPTGSIDYEWTADNSTDATILVDTTGDYSVTATNEYGCQTIRNVAIAFQFPYQEDKILLSSYSLEENKFFVVWQKTPNRRSMEYSIISGISQTDVLDFIRFDETNFILDNKTDPHLGSNYYNITLKDSCNNSSDLRLENTHKTMFLNTSETDEGNILLVWERYIGFDYSHYYVYRGIDINEMILLDSVQNRTLDKANYLDESAEPGIPYYYQIKVKTPETIYLNNTSGKKTESGPFVHSLSNLDDTRTTGTGTNSIEYLKNNLKLYPNPYVSQTTISYSLELGSKLKIEIYDILGKKVDCLFDGEKPAGDYELLYEPNAGSTQPGIYYLRFETEGYGVLTKMLIQN